MSRLIDDIAEFGLEVPANSPYSVNDILKSEVIVANNVAQYFATSRDDFESPSSFPNMAPPFDQMFIEYLNMKTWNINGTTQDVSVPFRSGVVISSLWIEGRENEFVKKAKASAYTAQWINDSLWPCWLSFAHVFVQPMRNFRAIELGALVWAIRRDGTLHSPIDSMGKPGWWGLPTGKETSLKHFFGDIDDSDWVHEAHLYARPAMLALSFMHCKNVTLIPNDSPREVQKRRIKEGKRPLIRYHTLNIEPMKKILRVEGQSEKTGLKMALHICRGHFKDYSKGKGLFGKFHDLYWWDSQVRGSIEHGAVMKDYNVKAPEGDQHEPA